MAYLLSAERESEATEWLLRACAKRFATDEAREFAEHCGREVFCGNLLWFEPYRTTWQFDWDDAEDLFDPRTLPTTELESAEEELLRRRIDDRLDPELRSEIDRFLVAQQQQRDWRQLGLGSNNLRTTLENVIVYPEDFSGRTSQTGIKRLRLIYCPTDWHHIQAFNNRMMDDQEFRLRALARGWVSAALPPNPGRVPSYITTITVVTGDDLDPYLVLSQRLGPERVRYFPNAWSISLEENMQGPRWVTRGGKETPEDGDESLHMCALRGLREEFGVPPLDVQSLLLLGLFVEAPTAAMMAIFWAHLKISWEQLVSRLPLATDPEARVITAEELDTANLVQVFLHDRYQPKQGPKRRLVGPGGREVATGEFHPSSRARLLAYLLTDTERHPRAHLLREFEEAGIRFSENG